MKHLSIANKIGLYSLLFLLFDVAALAADLEDPGCSDGRCCHRGPPGPPGPPGPQGPPFIATFATSFLPGDGDTILQNGDIVPFSNNEVLSGITNVAGDFTLSKSGVYQVTIGLFVNESNDVFDLELNGTPVSGGRLRPAPISSLNTLTVMFSALAGNHLVVKNAGGQAILGSSGAGSEAAFISILQIQ